MRAQSGTLGTESGCPRAARAAGPGEAARDGQGPGPRELARLQPLECLLRPCPGCLLPLLVACALRWTPALEKLWGAGGELSLNKQAVNLGEGTPVGVLVGASGLRCRQWAGDEASRRLWSGDYSFA